MTSVLIFFLKPYELTNNITGKRRYSIKLWKIFSDVFNCLPVAALIDDKIICMHGGLSPELNNISQVANIMRPTEVPDEGIILIHSEVLYE